MYLNSKYFTVPVLNERTWASKSVSVIWDEWRKVVGKNATVLRNTRRRHALFNLLSCYVGIESTQAICNDKKLFRLEELVIKDETPREDEEKMA